MKPGVRRRRGQTGQEAPQVRVVGGVTAARGFQATGVSSGIKKTGLDLALVFSESPANAAAVFTTNVVKAAPVLLSADKMRDSGGRVRAVLVNSGCANACTGERGRRDAEKTAEITARCLGIKDNEVVVASTGVIGSFLPIRRLIQSIPRAVSNLSKRGGGAAARAIMTTDTREKSFALEIPIQGKKIRIGGMAKGAGMVHPQMATMLSVITTDAGIEPVLLSRIFRRVVERTFNCLTIDGDTSTNDMVIILANGASGVTIKVWKMGEFEDALRLVCENLVKSIARDGEGATKLVSVCVQGAVTFASARRVAKAIAHSPLVKTALCGEELNWGRILCAAGYSGVHFDPDRVDLEISGVPVFKQGAPVTRLHARAEAMLRRPEVAVTLDLNSGKESATVWTCDLSRGYIDINANYIS